MRDGDLVLLTAVFPSWARKSGLRPASANKWP